MAEWQRVSGALVRIAAGSRTNVWGVNSAGNVYRWVADQGAAGWQQVSGSLKVISAGSRCNVWGAVDDGIYRYSNNDADPWVKVRGGATDIGAAADGTVWHIYAGGEIYRFSGDQPD